MASKKAKPKADEDDAKEMVLEYFTKENRPYSVNDVINNLNNKFGKTMAQRVIDSLVQEGKLREKVKGKQKLYYLNQDDMEVAKDGELAILDKELEVLNEENQKLDKQLKAKQSELSRLQTQPTMKELDVKIPSLTTEVKKLETRLKSIKEATSGCDPQETARMKKEFEKFKKEWSGRRRTAQEMIGFMAETTGKNRSELIEELGLETDEEAGVAIPAQF